MIPVTYVADYVSEKSGVPRSFTFKAHNTESLQRHVEEITNIMELRHGAFYSLWIHPQLKGEK